MSHKLRASFEYQPPPRKLVFQKNWCPEGKVLWGTVSAERSGERSVCWIYLSDVNQYSYGTVRGLPQFTRRTHGEESCHYPRSRLLTLEGICFQPPGCVKPLREIAR